ncbi:hypothetical protein RBB79_11180 [Tunturiibacter empetritectus]|uniref:Uncharacterized protein n=1 Tax=Tunturiibacter lichenicola TaxID=2051959 RepID=A0A852VL19_9BACT|nr:hypothetical protein [Edaphobacter lichenicola]NYF90132.1 hypothetical protein [Edaphobacter lichenicola]
MSRGQILRDRKSLTVRAPKGNFDGGKKKGSFATFVDLKLKTKRLLSLREEGLARAAEALEFTTESVGTRTDSPVPSAHVKAQARAEGIAAVTLQRTKDAMKIQSIKTKGEFVGGWDWSLAHHVVTT